MLLSLLLLLSAVLPVKAAAETAPLKVVRVGSFEDTFNYVNEKGARKGYGYELLETLSGYTGWQFEYVTCDWSDCFEKAQKRRDRHYGRYLLYGGPHSRRCCFQTSRWGGKILPLRRSSRADISASDFKTLNGKKDRRSDGNRAGSDADRVGRKIRPENGTRQHLQQRGCEAKAGKPRDRLLLFRWKNPSGQSVASRP